MNNNTQNPEDGILTVIDAYSNMTGNIVTKAGDLSRALGAAFRQGTYNAVLRHHTNILNIIVRTSIPEWIDKKNKDHKKWFKSASQMKEKIIEAINQLIEVDDDTKKKG